VIWNNDCNLPISHTRTIVKPFNKKNEGGIDWMKSQEHKIPNTTVILYLITSVIFQISDEL